MANNSFDVPSFRVLDTTAPRRVYRPSDDGDEQRKGLHFGQRKLLLSEVEFLTVLERQQRATGITRPLLVVYAGAAGGLHLPFLFGLFPHIRYVLIDPAPFCQGVQAVAKEEGGAILELISGYCTAELCTRLRETYGGTYECVLVSDIRSGAPSQVTRNAEHTEIINRDNALQESYCVALQPSWAMLKFHPPYPAEKDPQSPRYDASDDTPDEVEYLSGTALLGVWAPKSSSEVRLVVSSPFTAPLQKRMYNCREHEEQCYHYNCSGRYERDVAAERSIWEAYRTTLGHEESVESLAARASDALRHPSFLPLQPGYNEDAARWYALVHSVSNVSPATLHRFYEQWRGVMGIAVVERLVRDHSGAAAVPAVTLDETSSGVPLPREFWALFCRGNFSEAYSMRKVTWKFAAALHEASRKRGREGNQKGGKRGRDKGRREPPAS